MTHPDLNPHQAIHRLGQTLNALIHTQDETVKTNLQIQLKSQMVPYCLSAIDVFDGKADCQQDLLRTIFQIGQGAAKYKAESGSLDPDIKHLIFVGICADTQMVRHWG